LPPGARRRRREAGVFAGQLVLGLDPTMVMPLAPVWLGPTSRVRVASMVSPSFFLSVPLMAPRTV
jgi:hypothetical protein